jgi:LacI family transcriptional regulator
VPVTLKDIAARLDLSVTTVSRALGGYTDVAAETQQRILHAAQEMGYHPNVIAQSLQRQRSNTLGFVIPATRRSLSDPFFLDLLSGIGDGAAERGFDLLVSTCEPLSAAEVAVYERLVRGKRVDGVVIARTRRDDQRISYLMGQGFPVAAFGRTDMELASPYIDVDGASGVVLAMAHLFSHGHRRIAFISPPAYLMFAGHRLAGYREGLKQRQLPFDTDLVVEGDLSQASGHEVMINLLTLADPPTAVLCGNDLMALGAIHAVQDGGLVVGEDVAVVGFDDIPLAEHSHPPLTTVRQPIYEIGKRLAAMVACIVVGDGLVDRQVILQPELVVRASSANGERG